MGANLSSSYENSHENHSSNSNTVSQDDMSHLNASSLQARIEEIQRRTRLRRAPPPPPIRRSSLLSSSVEKNESTSEGNVESNSSNGKAFVIFSFFLQNSSLFL